MKVVEVKLSEDGKSFLRAKCIEMLKEYEERQLQIMEIYKNNPTYPFDFYNLSLREADTKMIGIREVYKRVTDEEL